MNLQPFCGIDLAGSFHLLRVEVSQEPFVDAVGRPALARTVIVGHRFEILLAGGMDDREMSVTLYHEVLEGATVAALEPPASVMDLNEGDFERIAHEMHDELGQASPDSLNRMLMLFNFTPDTR